MIAAVVTGISHTLAVDSYCGRPAIRDRSNNVLTAAAARTAGVLCYTADASRAVVLQKTANCSQQHGVETEGLDSSTRCMHCDDVCVLLDPL